MLPVTATTSPDSRASAQLIIGAFVCLLALGAIGWYAMRHPAPAPAILQLPKFDPSSIEARLQADPKNYDLLVAAANLYFDHQDYAAATIDYRRALALRPHEVKARTNLGKALYLQGDPDGALRELQTALADDPNQPAALDLEGFIDFHSKHDPEAAIRIWEHLLATTPNYPSQQRIKALLEVAKQAKTAPK